MPDAEDIRRELEEYRRREREALERRLDAIDASLGGINESLAAMTIEFRAGAGRLDERVKALESADAKRTKVAVAAGGGIGGGIVALVEAIRALWH